MRRSLYWYAVRCPPATVENGETHTSLPPPLQNPGGATAATYEAARGGSLIHRVAPRDLDERIELVFDTYTAYNTLPIPQLHIQQLLLLVHKCIYHK